MRQSLKLIGFLAAVGGAMAISTAAHACRPGDWILPQSGIPALHADLLAGVLPGEILLLGEYHDNARHHRWQASVISGLVARDVPISLGLEAFPRRLQPVLDRWVAGDLAEDAFRVESAWDEVWGFDWEIYLPIFELARLHRLPMVAINVERSLVRRVGAEGWDAIEVEAREGVSEPAPALEGYADMLRGVMSGHGHGDASGNGLPEVDEARLARFIQAQLTWDRAMAEGLVDNHHPNRVIVGIAGSGHLRNRWGIAHQLDDLGYGSRTWLPVSPDDCADLAGDLADAVFVIDEPPQAPPPIRLGVGLEMGEQGLAISSVGEGSVAASAGLQVGDLVRSAAGTQMNSPGDLAGIIRAQSPGSWLPLVIERDGVSTAIIAKLPVTKPAEQE